MSTCELVGAQTLVYTLYTENVLTAGGLGGEGEIHTHVREPFLIHCIPQ